MSIRRDRRRCRVTALRQTLPPADVNFSASGCCASTSRRPSTKIRSSCERGSFDRRSASPLEALIALLRGAGNAYSRYLALTALPDAVRAQLPLDPLFALAGKRVTAANVWLGDGGMRSDVHFDGPDNLLLRRRHVSPAAAHESSATRRCTAVVNLGSTLEGLGAVGEAEARYRGARRLRPTDPRPLHNLGIVDRRPDEAAAMRALALGPSLVPRTGARAELARMPEACGHFARAIALTPRDARTYTSLGRAPPRRRARRRGRGRPRGRAPPRPPS